MSSRKRDRSPSVQVTDPHSAEEKNPEEDEFSESEQELISGHDEPQSIHLTVSEIETEELTNTT